MTGVLLISKPPHVNQNTACCRSGPDSLLLVGFCPAARRCRYGDMDFDECRGGYLPGRRAASLPTAQQVRAMTPV